MPYLNIFNNPIADISFLESIEIDKSQNQIQYGDVFFTTSSETPEEVGMSSVWLGKSTNIYLNSFCFGFRSTVEFNPYYFGYLLRSDTFRKPITILAQGISRFNISKTKVMEIEIPLPSKDEQSKIGELFKNLDNLITLHQRKYEKLQTLKKALLEKMFPANNDDIPQIRFKGFTDAWEQRKYEDIGVCSSGGTLSYASLSDNGQYKCILYGDLYTLYNATIFEIERRTNQKGNTIYQNDILFPQSTTVDAYSLISPACLNDKTAETSGVFVIRPNKDIDGNFIAYYSKDNETQRNKLAKKAQGLTIVHLYYQSIKNEIILIPSFNEQIKISSLLINLDSLITLHQRK